MSGREEERGGRRRVAVVTGTRAEFGLLVPVMDAVAARDDLELLTVVAGAHLLPPALTVREVEARFRVDGVVPMQEPGSADRLADAAALGRGIAGMAAALERLRPAWVVVLGDRVEALAGAAAASVGGAAVAHVHGGDRAEGVADEAMRHAITKLAHLHLPATPASAARIARMGEPEDRIRLVGSPSIDGLAGMPPLSEEDWRGLGEPEAVFLMHPVGREAAQEEADAAAVLAGLRGLRVLALHPNHDPGREGIVRAIERSGVRALPHLARERFVGLLVRARVLVGNSSAGLIEAAALGCPAVDVGDRQGGRERAGNVVHVDGPSLERVERAVERALGLGRGPFAHPYGDGASGERIAAALAEVDPLAAGFLRKRCTY